MLKKYHTGQGRSAELKAIIEQSLDADKAENIVAIDLSNQSAIADYMIVASGRSTRQVAALAEKIRDRVKKIGYDDIKIEGLDQCNWVIVDTGDIVVHLFRPEVREFYDIEKMWIGAIGSVDGSGGDSRHLQSS